MMLRLTSLFVASLGMVSVAFAVAPSEQVVQGIYEGTLKETASERKLEARVVACGQGAFKAFFRQDLGEGKLVKVELDGKTEGDTVRWAGKVADVEWSASYADGTLQGTCGPNALLQLKRVVRESPNMGAKPPEGAILLLDGKNFDELTRRPLPDGTEQPWKSVDEGGIEIPKGGMNSKRQFDGSFRLHVEFKLPLMPEARGQGRANSGVYLPNGDEIQVLDSFGMTTYKGGGCGGIYAYKDPDTFDQFSLAAFPPLQWQTFDVEYHVQKQDGKPVGKPRVTVLHNGVKIHDNVEVNLAARVGGFHFQDHGNPVHFRNIWVLPLAD
ncbi:MAG: DUF1080 domain-containing protein [Planctomycetota bacterium]|nr:DUF1080 domain-containing protein [Planctomycetota bacterium]